MKKSRSAPDLHFEDSFSGSLGFPIKSCMKTQNRSLTRKLSDDYALKKVIFDEVEIQEYPFILGDSPGVTEGAPLSIDWKPQNVYSMDIDLYEGIRRPARRRGPKRKLMISSMRRVQTLVAAGYSLEVIGETIVDVDAARKLRYESATEIDWKNKVFGGLQTAMSNLKVKPPKRKSISNPAC